tara:strand:- start:386 stop:1153 length:768 start_codon:yes stop_codon:yes gene_type:complete
MGLHTGDLQDTMLKKVSIDEYEPKTGDASEVLVLGFSLRESTQGQDLYNFLNSSIFEIRDVEVSPNPNPDNYYMVFVEIDRNDKVLENIRNIVKDVENISGKLPWIGKTHLNDDFLPLFDEGISQYVISDPEKYMTKEQFQQQKAEEQAVLDAKVESDNSIMEFLKSSNLLKASINNNTLEVEDKFNEAKLEVVGFGEAKDIMAEIGINESAIGDMDSTLKQFNNMLGEMRAIPINEYIVIFHPSQSNVLVTKQI